MGVRAKVRCTGKSEASAEGDVSQIKFEAVIGESPENKTFFKWTPSLLLSMGTINPDVASQFEVGKEYYLDFSPAAKAETVQQAAERGFNS